ncbi:MAG: TatD family hydrolase [Anaerolineales bacterium]|nr:TatD family hydrolase [Chloroflexota bacterium]MBL7162611.1 TatD family hydrolase [Anaerolineales bacterium]
MTLTDTHCHLYFDAYDKDRDAVLARAWEAGVERILVPGIDLASSRTALELADASPQVYAAVGVHPNSALTWDAHTLDALIQLAAHPKVVAIGEIGLDYYRDRAPCGIQKRVLRDQVSLAGRVNLPIIIHTRNSSPEDQACFADIIEIIHEMRAELSEDRPGVFHSFLESEAEAQGALEQGFYIGITGPVTFNNAHELRRVVASTPVEKLLIETDGPFLTPHPHRGKRNEPAHVYYVAEKIAQVLGLSPRALAEATTANAGRLFQWRVSDFEQ